MAWRRTAARAARLEGGSDDVLGKAGFDVLPEAAFSTRRRLSGFAVAARESPVR